MGILDAPSYSKTQSDAKYLQGSDNVQWSVVSTRPVKLGGSSTASGQAGYTTRCSETAPYALRAVRLVYANWQNANNTAESPNYNGIYVKGSVHKGTAFAPASQATTDPLYRVTFNGGKDFVYIPPGEVVISDPVNIGLAAGERWYHSTYAHAYLNAAPATPTLTLVAGGSLSTAPYYVVTQLVYLDGSESLPSAEATITPTTGLLSIKVTSPAAASGAIGYRCYFGTVSGGLKFEYVSQTLIPFGTDYTLTATATTDGLSRMARTISNVGIPGGTGTIAAAGEAAIAARDYTTVSIAISGSDNYGSFYTPIGVLGVAQDGKVHSSVALIGDSIQAGTGDSGYGGALGGFGFRALANQTGQIAYDATKVAKLGFLSLAQGGETTATWVTVPGGHRRRGVSEWVTSILDEYGTNDLGSGSAVVYNYILSNLNYYAGRKKYFRTTIDPKTTTTDGWKTVAGQTISGTDAEADRRALNNCIKDSTGATTVTNEAMFKSPTSTTAAYNYDFYAGGDGTATKFFTAYPFRTGTETIKVNGATQTVTTNYTYLRTASIGGVTYASGITFVSAPSNGLSVTATYTKVAGFGSISGYSGYFDTATEIEVNSAGTKTANGGLWKPAGSVVVTGVATANNANTLTDALKSWTTDAYRGFAVRITADAVTPSSVGQVNLVKNNAATQLFFFTQWTVTPSATASYEIYPSYVWDGVHPSSQGHIAKSLIIDTTLF